MTDSVSHKEIFNDEVVTGDAVALEVPAAGVGVRILGAVIDGAVVIMMVIGTLVLADRFTTALDSALTGTIAQVIVIGFLVGWPFAWEQLTDGRSLGKLILGTRVVRSDGGPVRARQSLARALMASVELWSMAGLPALISSVASRRGQRLGDHLAGTHVVCDRVAWRPARTFPAPPGLARWASGCDLGSIRPNTLIAARSFLVRAAAIAEPARSTIGTDLAARLCRELSPQPPADAPPEAVIAATLAEHRARAVERSTAAQRLRQRILPDPCRTGSPRPR